MADIKDIMTYVVCEESFGRMYDFKCNSIDGFTDDYEAFYNWNVRCLEERSESTR